MRLAGLSLMTAALALTACASTPEIGSEAGCPPVSILAETETMRRYVGDDAMLFEAKVERVALTCSINSKEIEMDVTMALTAVSGTAARNRTQQLPVFVSVLRNGQLLGREVYPARAEFDEGPAVQIRHRVSDVTVPYSGSLKQQKFEVLVGFVLSREELARSRAGRR